MGEKIPKWTEFMRLKEFCKIFAIPPHCMYYLIERKGMCLPFVHRMGKLIYIDPKEFRKWTKRQGIKFLDKEAESQRKGEINGRN